MVDKKIKQDIEAKARQCLGVLAQLPMMEDKEARDAGNLVWCYCRETVCVTEEEKAIWDNAFHGAMPITEGDVEEFIRAFEDRVHKA